MRAIAAEVEECAVPAWGVIAVPLEAIPALRKAPGEAPGIALPPNFLKHADEQTVLAVAAILRALTDFPMPIPSLEEWAIVAAPRYFGRIGAANTIRRFRSDGPRGPSPMAVPTLSLHAVSACISLALETRGPSFGVGGGPDNIPEGLLAGLSLQLEDRPPGTWLILSEWDEEPVPGTSPMGRAVALALTDRGAVSDRLRLRLLPGTPCPSTATRLRGLAEFLAAPARGRWSCPLEWGGELQLAAEGGAQ